MIPTFINVGPGRCGTSWLHQAFRSHPQIATASVKETEFFNNNLDKGIDWYISKFPDSTAPAVGEISNNYYLDPGIAEKIREFNPDMRIVFNLREPESLLRSMYSFGERRGLPFSGSSKDLETPIGKVMGSGYDVRANTNSLVGTDQPTLLEAALLSRYIPAYLDAFGSNQVFFFVLERMKQNPAAELERLYEFLGVDPMHLPASTEEKVNDSMVPNSKTVARLASSAAFALRRAGADRLLTRLHDSKVIKSALFSKRDSDSIELPLETAAIEVLSAERYNIAGLVPEVRTLWNT